MKTRRDIKMFDNPVLEFLSLSGPKMMVTFHLILISIILSIGISKEGNLILNWICFGFGMLLWSISEYFLHKKLFHIESENKYLKAFHFAMHGHHHDHPHDTKRLFMPPVPASIFLIIFWSFFYLFIGDKAFFMLPGFELGYLIYSLIHYSIHTIQAPKGFEKLWHHHILHHYKDHDKAFGVSTRIWDKVFNTMPEEKVPSPQSQP